MILNTHNYEACYTLFKRELNELSNAIQKRYTQSRII